ncbi:MAG TPA: molybdopterin molybdotransferase MoeA [Pseudonocardiaceae bacterium]|jgi:molybdopterin molybdotransferase
MAEATAEGENVGDRSDVDWWQARRRAHAAVSPLPAERVVLDRALGRVLAQPVRATAPLPGFDSSAMDGYAVRGGPPWLVRGRTLAGEPAAPGLDRNGAWEVATGAPVPPDADAVVPYEDARRCGELLTGRIGAVNVRRAGEEAIPGDVVLVGGARVTPQVQACAAALGEDDLLVSGLPRVVALITGGEVVRSGRAGPGQVRDAIGPALGGQVRAFGARLDRTGYVDDEPSALLAAIVDADAELIAVSGSSSAGRTDRLRPVLLELGAEPVVEGVDCRPGHTQSLWRLPDGRMVAGLPGNPFAATVAVLTLVAPCCAGLLGEEPQQLVSVPLGALRPHRGSTRLIPVRISGHELEPVSHTGSAMVRGLASADALAVVPPAWRSPTEVGLLPLPGAPWWW